MIKVNVKKQGNYATNVTKIKSSLKSFFLEKGIVSSAEVSVAIVGKEKMQELGKEYLKEDGKTVHNVLSFTPDEGKGEFVNPPDGILHLGEIIICYPKVVEEANYEGSLIDDKVIELCKHGALHLMGIHHK
jgi:probable rRNA maturation factor